MAADSLTPSASNRIERTYKPRSPWRSALDRLFANRMAIFGGVIVLVFVFMAIFGQWLTPKDPLFRISFA